MLAEDEDAVICDFAEYYGVLDFWALDPGVMSTLAAGLRADSRIRRKIAGLGESVETLLLKGITDRLSVLLWRQTEDGRRGINPPKLLLGGTQEQSTAGFDTPEDFEAAREKALRGEG